MPIRFVAEENCPLYASLDGMEVLAELPFGTRIETFTPPGDVVEDRVRAFLGEHEGFLEREQLANSAMGLIAIARRKGIAFDPQVPLPPPTEPASATKPQPTPQQADSAPEPEMSAADRASFVNRQPRLAKITSVSDRDGDGEPDDMFMGCMVRGLIVTTLVLVLAAQGSSVWGFVLLASLVWLVVRYSGMWRDLSEHRRKR